MVRQKSRRKPPGTIWEIPDALWERVEPILKEFRPRKGTGRPPAHRRRTLNGVIFRMRSGCQWSELPAKYGPKSTVHDWFQRWAAGGVLEKIWAVPVEECDELGGVRWKWQAADGMLGKARFGGEKVGKSPTDRGKKGTKKSLLVDGERGPLGAAVGGANVPDCKLLKETIEAIVVEQPAPEEGEQHLCLDAGYDNPSGREAVEAGGHVGHIRPAHPDKRDKKRPGRRKPRRWVVERTFGRLSKGLIAERCGRNPCPFGNFQPSPERLEPSTPRSSPHADLAHAPGRGPLQPLPARLRGGPPGAAQ